VVKGKEAFGVIIVGKSDFIYLIHFISGLQVLISLSMPLWPFIANISYTSTLMHSRGKR